jgi:hypothetical protein
MIDDPDLAPLVEDLQWLLDHGEHPDHIPPRLRGLTPEAVAARVKRQGHRELANQLSSRIVQARKVSA